MDVDASAALASQERRRDAALALQVRGDFCRAIECYDTILCEHPGDWDVAHMRATCFFQLGAMDEACTAFRQLLDSPAARSPGFWTNLGLLLASVCAADTSSQWRDKLDAYRRFRPYAMPPFVPMTDMPSVSVVMPAYLHAPWVGEAMTSVFGQTRLPVELIVIDDGSRDATLECSRQALENAPIPVRLIARESREVVDRHAPSVYAAPKAMKLVALGRLKPGVGEVRANPRARSATLRVAQRSEVPA